MRHELRILDIGDTHITPNTPSGRKDVYIDTFFDKLDEIKDICDRDKVDYIIHNGDITQNRILGTKYLNTFIDRLKQLPPMFVVPGNHDVYGRNMSSLYQTSFGTLVASDCIKLLSKDKNYKFQIEDKILSLQGVEYSDKADLDPSEFKGKKKGDFIVLVAHAYILPKPFIPNTSYVNIKDINTNANIVISGHYHEGYKDVYSNGTRYFNPGSLMRDSYSKRNVQVLEFLFSTDEDGDIAYDYKYIPIGSDYTDVFDIQKHDEKKENEKIVSNVYDKMKEASNIRLDSVEDTLKAYKSNSIYPEGIANKSLEYLDNASVEEIKNEYKPYNKLIYITDIYLNNFESYDKVHISLVNGFNCITGEGDSGKSTWIRAIKWCLYDQYDNGATDMIRKGENKCGVKIAFSNGTYISRVKSLKDTGYYRIKKEDGSIEKYTKFHNNLPPDILQIHQMPYVIFDKDKVSINILEQLDGMFMDISGKRKSYMLGVLSNTLKADTALLQVRRDIDLSKKIIKSGEKKLKELKNKLKNYDGIEEKRLKVEDVKNRYKCCKDKEKKLQRLTQIRDRINHYNNIINSSKAKIKDTSCFDSVDTLKSKISALNRIIETKKGIENNNVAISHYKKDTTNYAKSISAINTGLNKLKVLLQKYSNLKILLAKYSKCIFTINNSRAMTFPASKLKELKVLISKYESILALNESCKKNKTVLEKLRKILSANINTIELTKSCIRNVKKEYRIYVDKIGGICPVCGGKLSNKII